MITAMRLYVLTVVMAATSIFAALYFAYPAFRSESFIGALSFGALAIVAQVFSYRGVPQKSINSIAFLPLLTIVVLSPDWTGLLAIAGAVALAEAFSGRVLIKQVFNVAAVALSAGTCVLAYRSLGGAALLTNTSGVFAAAGFALPLFLLLHTLLVYGVLAISTGQDFWRLLSSYSPKTILYDL